MTDQIRSLLDTHPHKSSIPDRSTVEECIKACAECHAACTSCADACLGEAMVADMVRCIRLNLDCASVCRATGEVLLRQTETDGSLVRAQLQACETACDKCGDECSKHAEKMAHCEVCAASCRRCADACRALLGTSASGGLQRPEHYAG